MVDSKFDGVWKHKWPSTNVLCDFLLENANLVRDSIVLELGAGAACLPSLLCLKLGARKVFVTDRTEAVDLIRENVIANCKAEVEAGRAVIRVLDWNSGTTSFLSEFPDVKFQLVLGSDCFFDTSVFLSLITTIRSIFDYSPTAVFIFAYQIRE
ncbi:Methyltransferase-like protein 23 isoform X5 [Aphelenchoides besseyi]|nr:Methyltransferase-like protein 23 isoform X5 [Aphelenchoides besseyi]